MEVNRCFGCMEETLTFPCPRCGFDPGNKKTHDYELRPGSILYGKYLVGNVLGQGGFGITYVGLDLALMRKVAIKEFFPSAHATRDTRSGNALQWYITEEAQTAKSSGCELFLKEARGMSKVAAVAQVVQVLDLFLDNETAYIVMDFVEGETLLKRLEKTGRLTWEQVRTLFLPIVDAMQEVHKCGLIHRDLSPDNLMLHKDGSIRILDLGAAKDLSINNGETSARVAKGGYSPLEQYVQRSTTGTWTDVYSLAATMYYALTGVVPISAVDRMDRDTLSWDLPQLRRVPPNVIQTLRRAMALRAEDRVQTMSEFAVCLRDVANHRKKPKKWVALAALLSAGLVAIAIFSHLWKDSPTLEESPRVSQEETMPDESEMPWGRNVLMSTVIPENLAYETDQASVFSSQITRDRIVSVTFLDSLDGAGSGSWDVSAAKDGSVLAWTVPRGTITLWGDTGYAEEIGYDLYIGADGGINGSYCANLFDGYQNVESIQFGGNFHTDYAKSMERMFFGCYALRKLDLRELNTAQVQNMRDMFFGCRMPELDISGFDTSNVRDMSGMFSSCREIVKLDLRHFDTSNVVSMRGMFDSCENLESLDVSAFNTSKVVGMNSMFSWCRKLEEVNISNFNTEKVEDMSFMFSNCGLVNLDLAHFDTSNVRTMAHMFSDADKLISVDITGFDTKNVYSMEKMFHGCNKLMFARGVENLDTANVEYYNDFMNSNVRINGEPWEKLFQ